MSRILALGLIAPALAWAAPPVAGTVTGGGGLDPIEAETIDADRDEGVAPRIINGADATIDDHPETGALIFDGSLDFGGFGGGPTRLMICSSTLIAPDVVLLAAHCIDPVALTSGFGSVSDVTWYWTREADLTRFEGDPNTPLPEDAIAAWDAVQHPDFDLNSMSGPLVENHDIALLFLEEPILDVQHAYLPTFEEASVLAEGDPVSIVGWGQQTATDQFESPPPGTVSIKQQAESFISELNAFEMKIGEVETDARKCHGDSGGPTFAALDLDGKVVNRLIGVTSHAYDNTDCFETGGVDTRVDHYLEWIEQEMVARCVSGDRPWCGANNEPDGIVYEPAGKGACGCNAAPNAGPVGLLALVGLFGLRRRR